MKGCIGCNRLHGHLVGCSVQKLHDTLDAKLRQLFLSRKVDLSKVELILALPKEKP